MDTHGSTKIPYFAWKIIELLKIMNIKSSNVANIYNRDSVKVDVCSPAL